MNDPNAELKREGVERARRLQERTTERQVTNQDRRNAEAGSPDDTDHNPRGRDR